MGGCGQQVTKWLIGPAVGDGDKRDTDWLSIVRTAGNGPMAPIHSFTCSPELCARSQTGSFLQGLSHPGQPPHQHLPEVLSGPGSRGRGRKQGDLQALQGHGKMNLLLWALKLLAWGSFTVLSSLGLVPFASPCVSGHSSFLTWHLIVGLKETERD